MKHVLISVGALLLAGWSQEEAPTPASEAGELGTTRSGGAHVEMVNFDESAKAQYVSDTGTDEYVMRYSYPVVSGISSSAAEKINADRRAIRPNEAGVYESV